MGKGKIIGGDPYRLLPLPAVLVCILFWTLPSPKPSAILGKLDYLQFLSAVAATYLALSFTAVGMVTPSLRKKTAMWIAMIWLCAVLSLAVAEGLALLTPAKHLMDNPFYTATSRGLKASMDLPFERPPHIRWEGLSRGDLALFHGDQDPYARIISFHTDHEGFRNSRDIEKAEIIFLGDSFTEAGSVKEEETFVRRVARRSNAVVRNLGRAGYSVFSELTVLKKYGLKSSPRLVVWQITERNDLEEALRYQKWRESGKPYFKIPDGGSILRKETWKKRSPSYRLYDLLREHPPWSLQGTFRDAGGSIHPVRFLPVLPGPDQSPLGHAGWPILAGALQEGGRMLRDRGIAMAVIYIPMKIRVFEEHVEFDEVVRARLETYGKLPPEATLSFHLRKLCDDMDVPFLDATPRFMEAVAEGVMAYLPYDTHLSAAGHAIVADILMERTEAGPSLRPGLRL